MKLRLSNLSNPLSTLLGLVVIMGIIIPANAGAQSADPFAGTWIWNAEKSRFTNQRLSITDLGNNSYILDNHEGSHFKVVADGTPQAQSGGATYSLRQEATGSWVTSYKGAVSESGVYKLSGGGQSLSKRSSITWADGGIEDRETQWQRVGNGTGLAGEWESRKFESKSASKPFELRIAPGDDGSLRVSMPAMNLQYAYKLDGKEYPDTNANAPKGSMIATKRDGDRVVHLDSKLGGTLLESVDYELSADGKTMSVIQKNHDQPTPIVYVMDRK